MIVLTSILYITDIVLSSFLRIQVFEIIVILISESISLSFVIVYSFLVCIVIERVIKFSSPDFFFILGLSRFSIRRRLRE